MLLHMFGSLNKSFLQDEEISIQPTLECTVYSMVAERHTQRWCVSVCGRERGWKVEKPTQ